MLIEFVELKCNIKVVNYDSYNRLSHCFICHTPLIEGHGAYKAWCGRCARQLDHAGRAKEYAKVLRIYPELNR